MALMCRFQRQWADVEALVCSRSPHTVQTVRDGTSVTEAGEWFRLQSAPFSPSFPWHLRRKKADVIVVHMPNPTAELAYLLARPKGCLVVRYHSDVVRQASAMRLYGPLQMHFIRQARLVIPTSTNYLNTSPVLSAVRDRCQVVPLGILPEEFAHPDPARVNALRTEYGGDFVLFSGRHRYYKGLPYLIEAAAAIRAPIVVAGDGPERAECMEKARAQGLRVHFPGSLSNEDLVAHLHACAVFAFPSVERSEAFGISILEAHACGKPVVATRLGTGVEYANEDGKTGLNVMPRNAAELADAINSLLDDPARRQTMGEYARKRVETQFLAEVVARQEFDLYQKALG